MIYVIKSNLPGKPLGEKPLPTGAHRSPPKGYPEKRTEYASPNEYKYPLDTEAHVRAAISYFSMPKNSAKYGSEERKAIWKRIVRAAKKTGIELSDEVLERAGMKKSISLVVPVTGRLEKARKLHYRTEFQGLPISVENRKGSIRKWYDPHEDRGGETKMQHPYGYIRLSEGEDGDHIDCYMGPNKESRLVAVVRQQNPINKTYDEDKVMLGFNSPAEAKKAYLAHYDNPNFFGGMDVIDIDQFKGALKENHEGAGGRLRLKIKKSIGYSREGNAHLVPKRIAVTRGGRTYQTTVWVNPRQAEGVAGKVGPAPEISEKVANNDRLLANYYRENKGKTFGEFKVGQTVHISGDAEVGIAGKEAFLVGPSGKGYVLVMLPDEGEFEEVPIKQVSAGRMGKACKTGKDEAAWDRATAQVHKEYPELSEDDERFWKIVQEIYGNMAGS